MTSLYPRERVEAVLQPFTAQWTVIRIMLKTLMAEPLNILPAPSRFCDGHTFSVLYAAMDLATSFVEVLVRDRFVQRETRIIPYDDVRARAWIEFELPQKQPLLLANLHGSGCVTLGAPTDAVHARNQTAGRTLACTLYEQYPEIDGILYQSPLTGSLCFAIFDRAFPRLVERDRGELEFHPLLPSLLQTHGIRLEI
jgi:hypothetical protein